VYRRTTRKYIYEGRLLIYCRSSLLSSKALYFSYLRYTTGVDTVTRAPFVSHFPVPHGDCHPPFLSKALAIATATSLPMLLLPRESICKLWFVSKALAIDAAPSLPMLLWQRDSVCTVWFVSKALAIAAVPSLSMLLLLSYSVCNVVFVSRAFANAVAPSYPMWFSPRDSWSKLWFVSRACAIAPAPSLPTSPVVIKIHFLQRRVCYWRFGNSHSTFTPNVVAAKR